MNAKYLTQFAKCSADLFFVCQNNLFIFNIFIMFCNFVFANKIANLFYLNKMQILTNVKVGMFTKYVKSLVFINLIKLATHLRKI